MREVSQSCAKAYAECFEMMSYIEVDPKTRENVEEVRQYFSTHLTAEASSEPITSVFTMHVHKFPQGTGNMHHVIFFFHPLPPQTCLVTLCNNC